MKSALIAFALLATSTVFANPRISISGNVAPIITVTVSQTDSDDSTKLEWGLSGDTCNSLSMQVDGDSPSGYSLELDLRDHEAVNTPISLEQQAQLPTIFSEVSRECPVKISYDSATRQITNIATTCRMASPSKINPVNVN